MPQNKMTPEQVAEYIKMLQSDKMNAAELEQYKNLNNPTGDDKALEFVKQQIQAGARPSGMVKQVPSEFMSKESDREKANAVMDQYRKPQSILPAALSQKDMDDSYNEFFGDEQEPSATQLARLAGQKGVITDQDLSKDRFKNLKQRYSK